MANPTDNPTTPRRAMVPSGGHPQPRTRRTRGISRFTLLFIVIAEYLLLSAMKPEVFLNPRTLQTILSSNAPLLIATLGLTLTLVIKEFDLSIGGVIVLSNVLIASTTLHLGFDVFTAVITALIASAIIGLANGLLVVYLGLNSFIVTLAMGTLLAGLATLLSGSTILSGVPPALGAFTITPLFGIPLVVYYAFGIALIMWYIYEFTPAGRYLYFIGDNTEVARLSGIPTQHYRLLVFIASSTIAGIAGILVAGSLGSADPSAGPSYLLPAFAAAFLGATAIKIGKFNAWGTVIASYLVVTGVTGLAILGLGGWVQATFNGITLLLAITAARIATTLPKRS